MTTPSPTLITPSDTIGQGSATAGIMAAVTDNNTSLAAKRFGQVSKQLSGQITNLTPFLPIFLNLHGKPYTLDGYEVMEPLFRIKHIPWRTIYKCGRQVGKSQSVAAQGVMQSILIPHFDTLYVLPIAEMTRRLSSNYVRPLIVESPLKDMITDGSCSQAVLQKSFVNGSNMFFSYAFLNPDRIRGLAVSKCCLDECQDLNWEFLPIIRECMSASKWGYEQYTGTPKTFDNTLQVLWEDSSQAEWIIKCHACNFFNVPSQGHHIMKMIGPVKNVLQYGTGLICAKCGSPIRAEEGRWTHRYNDRRTEFAGYHVPQPIMRLHYSSEKKWSELIIKRNKVSPSIFFNEVLGESCDVGTKLITKTELQAACSLDWDNDYDAARKINFASNYTQRILGIDWGGGGMEEISYTTLSVIGLHPTGRLELIYGERLHMAVNDVEEVSRILELFRVFQCTFVAHDFCGSGSVHETLLIQAGLDASKILPLAYVFAPARNIIYFHKPEEGGSRHYYSLDKARSLAILCAIIKTGHLRFPKWESISLLLDDFLHLVEDKIERPGRGDVFRIIRQPKTSDDFAHSCNYAAWAHFRTSQKYPDIASSFGLNARNRTPSVEETIQESLRNPPPKNNDGLSLPNK